MIMTGGFGRSMSASLWAACAVIAVSALMISPTMAARTVSGGAIWADAQSARSGEPITLSLDSAFLNDVLVSLTRVAGAIVLIDGRAETTVHNARVSGEFVDTPWDRVLAALLKQAGLSWTLDGNVMWVHLPGQPPPSPGEFVRQPMELHLWQADLREVLGTIEKLAGARIEVDPDVEGKVTGEFVNMPWDQAVDSLLTHYGFTWKLEGGAFHVSRAHGPTDVPLDAESPREPPLPQSVVDGEQVYQYVHGGEITEPVRLYAPGPPYTQEARDARIQGVVVLQTLVGAEGRVIRTKVLRGLPLGLTESAVETIRGWEFQPATLNGVPVAVEYVLAVKFRLDELVPPSTPLAEVSSLQ